MFREILLAVVLYLLVIFTVFALILALVWPIKSISCKAKAVSFDSYDYGPIQGCLVLHNGKWIPIENVRIVD